MATDSLSDKISCSDLVPKMFLRVDAANNFVDLGASSIFMTDTTALNILK